ncbi:MAG TPA: iron-containing redox enzyme family protein [Acidimicrobiales bacterium]|nr:iron-containing redox enzyme family protein [Acidimicrobiales bacterium]
MIHRAVSGAVGAGTDPCISHSSAARVLPRPRGPLSGAVLDVLAVKAPAGGLPSASEETVDPYGEDLQLALYLCYELHYRSFAGVDAELEWDPDLLRFRRELERPFLAALRADVAGGDDVEATIAALLVEQVDGAGPSHHLLHRGTRQQLREYVAHRSLYHLKEADPQAWVIPRLDGQAKSSFVTVEHDEYGAGRGERLHARLFAEMMTALDLDAGYGRYLDVVPAVTIATVNAMSLFGLHRSLRGALVGQFASVEITSSPGAARLARAVKRLNGDDPAGWSFYDEHVEADAVHEQVVRHGVVAALLAAEPDLAADVVFGIQVDALLENRLAAHLMDAWKAGQSSLRGSLGDLDRSRWLVSQKG